MAYFRPRTPFASAVAARFSFSFRYYISSIGSFAIAFRFRFSDYFLLYAIFALSSPDAAAAAMSSITDDAG